MHKPSVVAKNADLTLKPLRNAFILPNSEVQLYNELYAQHQPHCNYTELKFRKVLIVYVCGLRTWWHCFLFSDCHTCEMHDVYEIEIVVVLLERIRATHWSHHLRFRYSHCLLIFDSKSVDLFLINA